jgi:hypothetical protein
MEQIVLSRKELFDLVWSTPLLTLSKKFAISDNGIRKICKRMNIPLPQLGYWQKKAYGKSTLIKKMPKINPGGKEITLAIRGIEAGDEYKNHPLTELAELEKEIINDPKLRLKVPQKLYKPDKLIIAANEDLIKDKSYFSQYHSLIQTYVGKIDIKVSPKNLSRALRIMDTLIKLFRARGHDIYVGDRKTFVRIEGENIEIHMREKITISDKTDKWGGKLYEPYGVLAIIYGESYNWKEIKDGNKGLEDKMAKVLAILELKGLKEKAARIKREEYWRIQEEKEKILREKKERIEKERNDFKDLFNKAERWNQSQFIRAYIEKVEVVYSSKWENLPEEIQIWTNWAKQKADWYDPLINLTDAFLTDEDKKHILK